jgi:uracil-DNA glycosylase family 4
VETLAQIRAELGDCQRCKLCTSRKNIVFGNGSETADLMVVGQSAGQEEDLQGEPFVGRSGQLLDKLLLESGFIRSQVYVSNLLKCHPPGNRPNQQDELDACGPFLWRQIKSVQPKVIVALGKPAANFLLNTVVGAFEQLLDYIDFTPAEELEEAVQEIRGIISDIDTPEALLLTNHIVDYIEFQVAWKEENGQQSN